MTIMSWSSALLLLLYLTAILSAAEPPAHTKTAQTRSNPDQLAGLSCSRFEWNSEKSVMRVPLSLNRKQYWYQLDTGADEVIAYGNRPHEGWSPTEGAEGEMRIPRAQFAGMSFPAILAYPRKTISDENLQGTVGLDLLVGRTFIIDFPKKRICLIERADLPDSLIRDTDWSDAEIRHGKLFINMTLNGKKLDEILYDSGSSPTTLDLDLNLWKEFTGKAGTNEATTHSKGQSWGQEIESIGAPATGDLIIGHHIYRTPSLTTIPARPDSYRTNFRAQGSLGNALFTDSIVILDLGAHPRFGIIDSPSR
jgi:hypothetical protein